MTSKNTGSISGSRSSSKADAKDNQINEEGEQVSQPSGSITSTIQRLKKQLSADRLGYVKERIESNRRNLEAYTANLLSLSESRKVPNSTEKDGTKDMFNHRIEKALCKLSGLDLTTVDKESVNCQEEGSNASSTIIFGSNSGGKSIVRPIKLLDVEKIPPYTTWIFLDRNQRMTDDQSVVGRRRIYYDQSGNEALICSDSEEDTVDEEEEKHEFCEGDDYILRMTIQEHGSSQAALDTLSQCLEAKPCEIKRYESKSNVLYRQDMNFLWSKTSKNNVLSLKAMDVVLTIQSQMTYFLEKILMQLWIHLIICFVAVVWFLIVVYMVVLRGLFSLVKNNHHGALLKKIATGHVALTAIYWLQRLKK